MSNIHVLEATQRGENENSIQYKLVFHITVPAGNNSAGIDHHTIIKETLARSQKTKSILPSISPEELQDITDGKVLEIIQFYPTTPLEKRTRLLNGIRALYNEIELRVLEALKQRYKYYGYEE